MKIMKFYIKTSKSEHFCSKCCCISETRFLQPNSNLPRHNSKQKCKKRSFFHLVITETLPHTSPIKYVTIRMLSSKLSIYSKQKSGYLISDFLSLNF